MATVEQAQAKLTALINNLSPQARRQLARKPQKQFGKKKGRIKRKAMFAKLRTAKYLKVWSNGNEVSVGFNGSNATIANVHQYGLKGTVNKNKSVKVKYAQRELLGFSESDVELIENLITEQLSL